MSEGEDSLDGERQLNNKIFEAGVYLATGEEFHSEQRGWFRVVFTTKRDMLEEGLRKFVIVCTHPSVARSDMFVSLG